MIKKISGNILQNIGKYNQLKIILPTILANEVKNHFLLGFRKGGHQTDSSRFGWAPRKRIRKRERNKGNRAILVDTGALRADIKIRKKTFNNIIVGTYNIPYAEYHNDGTERLPQREFIGQSKDLERKLFNTIITELNTIFK